MNNFLFSQSAPEERDENFGPPTERFVEYVTLKESPMERNEVVRMHEYVERSMKTVPYVVQSESDFDYMYENAPNGIRGLRRGFVCVVHFRKSPGKGARKDFVFRFLPSPLYEIEKQKEYDAEQMKRAEKMKIEELKAKKDVIAEEEKSRKVSRQLSDEEALRSFQKAKMMAEQNASMPPSIDSLEFEPMVIPLTEEDKIPEERQKKDAKDAKEKEKEMQMLNSFLRNKERIKGLKSPSGPSAP